MRFLIRLIGALWLTTLIVSVGFAWYEVHQDRKRLEEDLQRRATLTADAVREASERLVARGAPRAGADLAAGERGDPEEHPDPRLRADRRPQPARLHRPAPGQRPPNR